MFTPHTNSYHDDVMRHVYIHWKVTTKGSNYHGNSVWTLYVHMYVYIFIQQFDRNSHVFLKKSTKPIKCQLLIFSWTIWNHWQLKWLFNQFSRLITQVTSGFPSQVVSNAESISMPWHYHDVVSLSCLCCVNILIIHQWPLDMELYKVPCFQPCLSRSKKASDIQFHCIPVTADKKQFYISISDSDAIHWIINGRQDNPGWMNKTNNLLSFELFEFEKLGLSTCIPDSLKLS